MVPGAKEVMAMASEKADEKLTQMTQKAAITLTAAITLFYKTTFFGEQLLFSHDFPIPKIVWGLQFFKPPWRLVYQIACPKDQPGECLFEGGEFGQICHGGFAWQFPHHQGMDPLAQLAAGSERFGSVNCCRSLSLLLPWFEPQRTTHPGGAGQGMAVMSRFHSF